jgi:hypothetical protein
MGKLLGLFNQKFGLFRQFMPKMLNKRAAIVKQHYKKPEGIKRKA